MHLTNLQSWPWGLTFDSFAPLDSDQGPALMQRINLKVLASVGGDFRFIRSIRFGPGSASNESDASQVLALGAYFVGIRFSLCIRFRGPGGAWWSLNLKSWGATFDAVDALDSDPGPNLLNLMYLEWSPQDFRYRLHQAPPGPLHRMHRLKRMNRKSARKART